MDKEKAIEEIKKLKGSIDLLENVFRKAQGHLNNVIMQSAKVYQQSKQEGVCEWIEIESKPAITTYKTQCERTYYHNAIHPQYYNSPINFCPYCGNRIEIVEGEDG